MDAPNTALRAARISRSYSQDELARLLRQQGVGVSKRLVQRWETGTVRHPRPASLRALEAVFGVPATRLGFNGTTPPTPATQPAPTLTPYTGIWLSCYEYVSDSRGGQTFTGRHHVVIVQSGDRLSVSSVHGSADSQLSMDLTVDAAGVVTGTWTEQTSPAGHYRGARYHGAIQLLADPTGHRMAGKWVGFGSNLEINTGPWSLTLIGRDTSRHAMADYEHPPE